MSRQLEQSQERKAEKRRVALENALDGGLEAAVAHAGGELSGFSVKSNYDDSLLVVRALFPAGPMVAFVGGFTASQCFIKAAREAGSDGLRWREDRFRGNGVDGGNGKG